MFVLAGVLALLAGSRIASPAHATTIWQSNSSSNFLTAGNWSAGVPTTSPNTNVATFNGTGSQNNVTFSGAVGGTSGGDGINGMLITGSQTAPLSINATTAASTFRFRRNTGITINAGAGAFSMGTSGQQFFLQPSSNDMVNPTATFTLTNNSSNTATLGTNVTLHRGGSFVANYIFTGTGDWDVQGATITPSTQSVIFTKTGSGRLTLGGANTNTPVSGFGVTFSDGTLRATNTAAFGGGSVTNNGDLLELMLNGAGNNGTISFANAFTTNTGNNVTIHVANLTANTGNTIELAGNPYTLGNSTINVTGADGYALRINNLGVAGVAAGTAVLNPTSANLILGTVNNTNANAHTLELGGSATGNQVTGAITNSSGVLSIAKTGVGTWTFEGANTYTGTTAISAGTLAVNGTHTTAGAYTVTGGTLAGDGVITTASNASVTVSGSGKLSPGDGGLGTLTMNLGGGSLNLAGIGLGALQFDLGPGGTSDRVQLNTGTLALSTLNFDEFQFYVAGTLDVGDTFLLFDANNHSGGLGVTSGFFANGNYGGVLSLVGNDVWLTINFSAVPEPSTFALGLGGAAALALAWRRRRKSAPR